MKFSILMAVYAGDDSKLFEKALRSVLENSLVPSEIVLVVDGPIPDEIRDTIEKVADWKFKIVYCEKNLGLASALNIGLKYVSCEWVVRMDSDDVCSLDRFAQLSAYFCSGFDVVGSFSIELNEAGVPSFVKEVPQSDREIRRFCRLRNPMNHNTVAFRLEAVQRCGGYPNLYLKEDYGLWITMLASGAVFINLPEILVFANGGDALYKRRSGVKYIRSEYYLQKHMLRAGFKSFPRCITDFILRSVAFSFPTPAKKMLYELVLRKKFTRAC